MRRARRARQRHAAAANTEIQAADPRSFDVRASAAFTTAKMMRNPALPIVAMFLRFTTFARTIVAPAVMNSPSRGWFHVSRPSSARQLSRLGDHIGHAR